MPQVNYSAFHIYFSTLDIERGKVSLQPSHSTLVVLPQRMPDYHIICPAAHGYRYFEDEYSLE